MPIYEYKCSACGHELETLQKFSDAPLTECPQCGKPTLQKLISAAGFQLKGTGWYVTDFKNKDKKPAATAEGTASADKEKPKETKPSSEKAEPSKKDKE